MINYDFIMEDYQNQKPFSSFFSGVAGKMGIPLWAYYVNRGQLIASFGIRNKNRSIMEFLPANLAYIQVPTIGFRTFIKVDNKVYEFFRNANKTQKLSISNDIVKIEEINNEASIKLEIYYSTLPNESYAGLLRRVIVKDLSNKDRIVEVIDGLAQILTPGIELTTYKAMANLMPSWMQSYKVNDFMFYKMRSATGDTAEVEDISEGHFYISKVNHGNKTYLYDYKAVFGLDTTMSIPNTFINNDYNILENMIQTDVNQIPSAFTLIKTNLKTELVISSMIGHAITKEHAINVLKSFAEDFVYKKMLENRDLHNELMHDMYVKTSEPLFDKYMKQMYLDNVLRGGKPYIFETKNQTIAYHLFSRKHGDLERDYNFFNLEPSFYSQGNGNFRDILQNRRNDLLFEPKVYDTNILQFTSLIQADGYNPLSIEGLRFTFEGDFDLVLPFLIPILKESFTPGDIATALYHNNCEIEENLRKILSESKPLMTANYTTGYWGDHFTYIEDLIEQFENIYPDKINSLIFDDYIYPYYDSPVIVNKRDRKYVLVNNVVRQYGAIKRVRATNGTQWLKNNDGIIKVNLIGKLLTLLLNKYACLDPFGIGISYEAGKPGWNDAMNGLSGLFGSGVSEMVELRRISKRLVNLLKDSSNQNVRMLKQTHNFAVSLNQIDEKDTFNNWDERSNALENYRESLGQTLEISNFPLSEYQDLLLKMDDFLEKALNKAKNLSEIMPTFLTYEVTDYQVIRDDNNEPICDEKGRPYVKVLQFDLKTLPSFLESPARYLKVVSNYDEAKKIYNNVKKSELYDKKLKVYQTSVSLDSETKEIGRIVAFTKGWLERESNFMHMTYKYLYGVLKADLCKEFYDEIKTNFTCFMDPKIYGRSPLEISSYIVTSGNPDSSVHGQGFVSRLSGTTTEMLSMWQLMFLGKKLFSRENNVLKFTLSPRLINNLFDDENKIVTRLFNKTDIYYINESRTDVFKDNMIKKINIYKNGKKYEIVGSSVYGDLALDIRNKKVDKIEAII